LSRSRSSAPVIVDCSGTESTSTPSLPKATGRRSQGGELLLGDACLVRGHADAELLRGVEGVGVGGDSGGYDRFAHILLADNVREKSSEVAEFCPEARVQVCARSLVYTYIVDYNCQQLECF
jgi:hypothetical protein